MGMKKYLSAALILALLLSTMALMGCREEAPEVPKVDLLLAEDMLSADPAYVKLEGRYDYTAPNGSDPGRINLYHTASGFTVQFTGTALYAEFYSEISGNSEKHYPYYNVAVDDEVLPTAAEDRTFCLTGGQQRITIVEGLPYGEHTVKCLKMSEPYDALTSIVLMETDGGFVERDAAYDAGNFRFMFVCASGGSGHGSLGYSENGGNLGRTTSNSSSLHAFNYLTARMFGADVQFVANSGWGVSYPKGRSILDVLEYSGITTSNNVSGAQTTAAWDHQKWIPDVIIFNIGGNDTTADGFEKATYQKEVVQLVKRLHELYPKAYMIWTHTNSNAGKYAVSALTDAGIMKESYIQVAIIPKVGADGTVGANNHNSIATHIATADILKDILAQTWGFTPVCGNISIEEYTHILEKFG
jgi:hypothetical protein